MKTKLTLTIDETIKKRAKKMAKRRGMSVSEMVEQYLENNIDEDYEWQPQPGSWVDQLLGSSQLPEKYKDLD
ncbi:MAG: DUF6364 family protein, partial [Balneolales bacterium]